MAKNIKNASPINAMIYEKAAKLNVILTNAENVSNMSSLHRRYVPLDARDHLVLVVCCKLNKDR